MPQRRDFLQWLGAGSVAAAAGISLPAAAAATETARKPVSTTWDMSWCDRVNGKVRAVFDSPQVSEGAAVFRAALWRDQQKEVYSYAPADLSTVIVIRHEAIPLVMNDEFWNRFGIAKELKLRDQKGKKWAPANPVGVLQPGTPASFANYNIGSFIASGGVVLACNLAFGDMVSRFKTADKLSSDDARAKAVAHLIPGVILQPSGGFAVHRAQQAGCSYMIAS